MAVTILSKNQFAVNAELKIHLLILVNVKPRNCFLARSSFRLERFRQFAGFSSLLLRSQALRRRFLSVPAQETSQEAARMSWLSYRFRLLIHVGDSGKRVFFC